MTPALFATGFHFASPWWLLALLLIPGFWLIHRIRRVEYFPALKMPSLLSGQGSLAGRKHRWPKVARVMFAAAFAALTLAMARPQWPLADQQRYAEGIDIVITMDISLSMLARDFQPDRLEASKDVAARFIQERGPDRIGLVVFAGQPFSLCPLTGDKAASITLLQQAQAGFIEDGSTAIGDGIATAINRLRESDARSKVIILLTDGENNAGNIDPVQAAEIAAIFGIRLYTIGVGSRGIAIGPVDIIEGNILFGPVEVAIDEKTLTAAAEITGGRYFRAIDKQALSAIYKEIDTLEKSRLEVTSRAEMREVYPLLLWIGLILIMIVWLIRYLFVKTLP